MQLWERMKKWGRGLMQRTASATGIAREYKDIFEVGGVPAYRQFYDVGIFLWKALYRGLYRPWHIITAPTIKNANATRQIYRLNMAKAVCAELASLVWGEQCEIHVSANDWKEEKNAEGVVTNPDPLNAFVQHVLSDNAFGEKMQELIEQELALGGAAIRVCRDARRDREGKELQGSEFIRLDYCMADQFVPTAWDNKRATEGVFISRVAKGGYYYTLLQWHAWDGLTYTIRNDLYRSEMMKGTDGQNQDILGIRVPLAELYPWMDEEAVVNVGESMFAYFRTPIANNIDDNSPLGVSIYANALETLHAIDICYDSFVREFELGKKKIIVPARFLKAVSDSNTGEMRRYYDPNDETYVGVADDDGKMDGPHDVSPELRIEQHVSGINAHLNTLCLQIGFSANTFSFDEKGGLKTATEVISENSKTYKTIKTIQNQIAPALEHIVRSIIELGALYGMEWEGKSIAALAENGFEVKVNFDDGVTQDRTTNLNEGVMLVGAGVLSKFTLLTDRKYGIGLTEKEAAAELERVDKEKQNTRTIDENQVRLFGGGA